MGPNHTKQAAQLAGFEVLAAGLLLLLLLSTLLP